MSWFFDDTGFTVAGIMSTMFGGLTVFLVLVVGLVSTAGAPTEGQHNGVVTSVETSGIIWKTHRVYVKTDAESTQEDVYCVTDDALLDTLRTLADSRERITLQFHRPGVFVGPWDCGGESAIVYGVKP